MTSTATVAPVPRPPQIAELLAEWKSHARKHERPARENHQAAQLAGASREAWREKAETIARRHAVTEAALWARVTGRAWPSTPSRPALVEVRFVSNLHRTRTLAQFTNARDARNAARTT